MRLIEDVEVTRELLDRHTGFEETELSEGARIGIRQLFGRDLSAIEVVREIIASVRISGDDALRDYTARLDGAAIDRIEIDPGEWQTAFDTLPSDLQDALLVAAEQIRNFHQKQVRTSWFDFGPEGALGQLIRPLARIGVYAPGGTAAYPSSLLMTAVPARVAGVEEIIVCSPPTGGTVSPLILAAAYVAEVDRLFQVGGAQAIAAMAYGTDSVPHVDKICGPGNIFVVLAKREVYGSVAIDQMPGPTETMIVADETADPRLVAADLIAQAEHDPMASAILLTTSQDLGHQVMEQIDLQLETLPRGDIAMTALDTNGLIAVVPDRDKALELANAYGPEHLCLLIEDAWDALSLVQHAGGVFLGEHSPEALADYTAGPSHVMPTGGTSRFFSPIHVGDFTKVISVAAANEQAMNRLGSHTMALARAEGLEGHARAIEFRLADRE